MTQTKINEEIEKIKNRFKHSVACKEFGWSKRACDCNYGIVIKAIDDTYNLISSKKESEWKKVIKGLMKDRQEAIDKYCKAIDEIRNIRDITEIRKNLIEKLRKREYLRESLIEKLGKSVKELKSKLEHLGKQYKGLDKKYKETKKWLKENAKDYVKKLEEKEKENDRVLDRANDYLNEISEKDKQLQNSIPKSEIKTVIFNLEKQNREKQMTMAEIQEFLFKRLKL